VQHDLLDFTIARIRQMLQSFAAAEMPAAQPELIAALRDLAEQLAATAPAASPAIEARLDDLVADTMDSLNAQKPMDAALDQLFRDTFAEISASAKDGAASETAAAPEMVKARGEDSIDDLFNAAFDDTFAEPPLRMAEPIALAPELAPIPQVEPEPVVARRNPSQNPEPSQNQNPARARA
jgi:chemosensory pili system protein ChpA (sensor histidine kinase/response regulator)